MGYCMFLLKADFYIAHSNHALVLNIIKKLDPKKFYPNSCEPHFAFVNTLQYQNANTLGDALKAWRWLPDYNEEGDIISLVFLGEKLGNDEILFKEIACYVGNNSFIQMAGEDNNIWRWFFFNGIVTKQKGIVIFE